MSEPFTFLGPCFSIREGQKARRSRDAISAPRSQRAVPGEQSQPHAIYEACRRSTSGSMLIVNAAALSDFSCDTTNLDTSSTSTKKPKARCPIPPSGSRWSSWALRSIRPFPSKTAHFNSPSGWRASAPAQDGWPCSSANDFRSRRSSMPESQRCLIIRPITRSLKE